MSENIVQIEPGRRLFSNNVYGAAITSEVQITPTAGRAIRLLGFSISTSGANTVDVEIGGVLRWRFYFGANGGETAPSGRYPMFYASVGETISITSSGEVNLSVSIWGYEEDV